MDVMTSDELPETKPIFLSKEATEASSYQGCDERPTFDAELASEAGASEEMPVEGVRIRYAEIARLHALGLTNNQIGERLGYLAPRVSGILRHPFVIAEVARLRDKIFDQAAIEVLKEASLDGVKLIHRVILNEKEKMGYRLDAAKWAKEQAHGKAHQSLSVENNTLNVYIEAVRAIREQNERDVTPAKREPSQELLTTTEPIATEVTKLTWDAWLDENLPDKP